MYTLKGDVSHPCEGLTAVFNLCNNAESLQDRYYRQKLELDPSKESDLRKAVKAYVEGLHWVLEYYYRGVASWSWYYPYHYAPMASDLKDLGSISIHFDRGQPLTAFQQLLAVLPAASYKLLPKCHQVGHPNQPPSLCLCMSEPLAIR